jgi:hypothetical protein
MSAFSTSMGGAANAALCQILSTYGDAAPLLITMALAEPTPVGEGIAAGSALAAAAAQFGCTWDPAQPGPTEPNPTQGCTEFSTGNGILVIQPNGTPVYGSPIVSYKIQDAGLTPQGDPSYYWWVQLVQNGPFIQQTPNVTLPAGNWLELIPNEGAICAGPPAPPTVPVQPDPIDIVDPNTNCNLTVNFLGFATGATGVPGPVVQVQPTATKRTGGGVISGCNFDPVIVYQPPPGDPGGGGGGTGGGGGGGGPIITPVPDNPSPTNPDDPWWGDLIKGAVSGAVAGAVEEALEKLLEQKYPASSRTISAPCEVKEDGSPETYTINFPEENFNNRVITALDAIVDFQQQFALWKTPSCDCIPKPQKGDAVTINWVSDEYSAAGGNRIRKLLTYFDQNGTTLEATVSHWRDFTWSAGPVVVSPLDSDIGRPQVWASTEAEGKRVIQHAASIAGVDLTNTKWLVSASRSARYGQPGLMRVHRSNDGLLGITKRGGPSGLPNAQP